MDEQSQMLPGPQNPNDQRKRDIRDIEERLKADVLIYAGETEPPGYASVIECLSSRANRRKKVILILTTYGGDPHEAYRIARAIQASYDRVTVMVLSRCKSAGTLICLGAHYLVLSDMAELGPIDVQMLKQNEVIHRGSTMDVPTALQALEAAATETFKRTLLEIHVGGGVTTKLAGEIAAQVTVGLYKEMYHQIDPIRLGEITRAMNIAVEYGNRLAGVGRNTKRDTTKRLVAAYPSHEFVIDRYEVPDLFKRVRSPNRAEMGLLQTLTPGEQKPGGKPYVMWLDESNLAIASDDWQDQDDAEGNSDASETPNGIETHQDTPAGPAGKPAAPGGIDAAGGNSGSPSGDYPGHDANGHAPRPPMATRVST